MTNIKQRSTIFSDTELYRSRPLDMKSEVSRKGEWVVGDCLPKYGFPRISRPHTMLGENFETKFGEGKIFDKIKRTLDITVSLSTNSGLRKNKNFGLLRLRSKLLGMIPGELLLYYFSFGTTIIWDRGHTPFAAGCSEPL